MMQEQFSFTEFGFSSEMIRNLVDSNAAIQTFVGDFFSLENLKKQARAKQFTSAQRESLVHALNEQNKSITLSAKSQENITILKNDKTVTVTTGHQLNLLTGPLYSIYKVAQVISICAEMNLRDSEYKYVPVFWMATEDHDFEEINHINLFGNKIAWDKNGQESKIVGEIKPDGMEAFTNQIEEKYRDEDLKKQIQRFTKVYKDSNDLAAATRQIMNELFAAYGLVIIDGNDGELKKSFVPIAQKEVAEEFVFKAVSKTNEILKEKGYHNQVYVRNCNLFYIDKDGTRKRISKQGDTFFIGETEKNLASLMEEIKENPKAFSPNALLRPVYQELILPNVAYIGGGGEIAYWLQLKDVFNAIDLLFPLLRVRDSILLLKNKEVTEMDALPFSIPDLKRDLQDLVKEIALSDVSVDIKLDKEITALNNIKTLVMEKGDAVGNGLSGMIAAEFVKMEKSIERLESKLIKAEKSKHEQKANKISKLQSKIYPNGGFQERYENFLPYFLNDENFIDKIVKCIVAEDLPKIRILEI